MNFRVFLDWLYFLGSPFASNKQYLVDFGFVCCVDSLNLINIYILSLTQCISFQRYAIALEGEVVSHSYVVDQMMGKFAAALVVLARDIEEEVGIEELEAKNRATSTAVRESIEVILLQSHPEVIPYYSCSLDRGHKYFLWTGPDLLILPCLNDFTPLPQKAKL